MWSRCLHTRGNSCIRCRSRMWMRSSDFHRRSPSTRSRGPTTLARPSRPSPRSMTICVFSMRASAGRIVWCAIARSRNFPKEEILETIIHTVTHIKQAKNSKEILGVEVSNDKVKIFSPVVVGRKGEYYQLLYDLLEKGYETVKVDGEMKKLRNQIVLAKNKAHDIDVLVDEFYISEFKEKKSGIKERLSDAVEKAIEESKGLLKIETPEETKMISVKFMCPYDGYSYPEIEPRLFSFNSPYGACPECHGLGTKDFWTDDRLRYVPRQKIARGSIARSDRRYQYRGLHGKVHH